MASEIKPWGYLYRQVYAGEPFQHWILGYDPPTSDPGNGIQWEIVPIDRHETVEALRAEVARLHIELADIKYAARNTTLAHDELEAKVERLRAALQEAGPCKVYEYDGAFKCVTHDRVWGAITNADEPCPGALQERER